MDRIKFFFKENWVYVAAFVIPWIIFVIRSFLGNTWVTGNGCILTGDAAEQLVPFFYELWNKVHNGESLVYTWNCAGGVDFSTMTGYLISPFTLLVLLAPKNSIVDMVQFITVLKWTLIGVSATYFFMHTRFNTMKKHREVVSLFLGFAFCMGSSVIRYFIFIQFNDVLICFPLLLLLVEKMVEEKKWKLYTFLMAWCMYSNLYLMFSVCIFLVLWFFVVLESDTEQKLRKFLLFAGSSLLAALACFAGIVSGFAMAGNRLATEDSVGKMNYISSLLVSPADFVKQLFFLQPISATVSKEPNIYFSIIGVVLVVLFAFIKIDKKKKIYTIFVMLLLTGSIFWGALSIVWHVFNVPNAVYHRFVFAYTMMLLVMALQVMCRLKDLRLRHIAVAFGVVLVAFVVTFFSLEKYENFIVYQLTIMLLVLYAIFFVLYKRKSISHDTLLIGICVVGLLELCGNLSFTLGGYGSERYFDGTRGQVVALAESIEDKLSDGGRLACQQCAANVNLLVRKNGDSGFLSSINGFNQRLHQALGLAVNGSVEYSFQGGSPLLNLLFHVRYAIAPDDACVSDATALKENGDYTLYRIDRTAGLGYMVDSSVEEWDYSGATCFENQNDFVKKATGESPIFTIVSGEMDLKCYNALEEEVPCVLSEGEEVYLSYYDPKYRDDRDSMFVRFTVPRDMDLYMYSICDYLAYVSIFVDDEMIHSDKAIKGQSTLHVGQVKKGQEIIVCTTVEEDFQTKEQRNWMLEFAEFHEENFAKVYEKLSSQVYQVETFESDYVSGTIEVEEPGIMMTSIQAAEGFTVLVDGEPVDYKVIADTMIGVPLDIGEHQVEFCYERKTPIVAKIISYGAMVLYVCLCLYGAWNGKRRKVNEE